jgi:hypothetical protein
MSKRIMKIAIQTGSRKDKRGILTRVPQVKIPGITSRYLWAFLSFGLSGSGLGNLNIWLNRKYKIESRKYKIENENRPATCYLIIPTS